MPQALCGHCSRKATALWMCLGRRGQVLGWRVMLEVMSWPVQQADNSSFYVSRAQCTRPHEQQNGKGCAITMAGTTGEQLQYKWRWAHTRRQAWAWWAEVAKASGREQARSRKCGVHGEEEGQGRQGSVVCEARRRDKAGTAAWKCCPGCCQLYRGRQEAHNGQMHTMIQCHAILVPAAALAGCPRTQQAVAGGSKGACINGDGSMPVDVWKRGTSHGSKRPMQTGVGRRRLQTLAVAAQRSRFWVCAAHLVPQVCHEN